MSLKLYELDEQIERLLDTIYSYAEANEGEIPDELDNSLDQLQAEKESKVLDIARYIKSLKAEADAIKTEADKLHKRYKTVSNFSYRLKTYLKMHLRTGEKYKDNNTLISWRKSEAVRIIDENSIPDELCSIIRSPSLTSIKNLIKSGTRIDGAELVENHNILIR